MEESTLIVDDDGNECWYLDGKLHRLDGPACEYANGGKVWFLNGVRHRLDGPAVECANGRKYWVVNGNQHRWDGPAVEDSDGNKAWWVHGNLHRFDGPAVDWDGVKQWYWNGLGVSESECMANQVKLLQIPRWWRNHKLQRFVRLTTKNKEFIESFYSPEGKGGIWHKRKMMAALQEMID